ncbi:hypothetical protein HKBW3S06_01110, partial [Candidatus Hakubella thermalkaliphila]
MSFLCNHPREESPMHRGAPRRMKIGLFS